MLRQKTKDTCPELALRTTMHALGLRYFVHRRPLPDLRCEADVLFPRARVAVFVQGCFWHGCPEHGRRVGANGDWWRAKIVRTKERDERNRMALTTAGWLPVYVWEHEDPAAAAIAVRAAVRGRTLL